MIPTDCPYGDDPRMCEYCSLKDTCDHKCCPKTTVAWGNITGLLTDQTDLTAELDKRKTEVETKITESAASLQTAIDNVDAKVETNTTNIAANTTNIADLNTKHNELQATLEDDYYKSETVDTKLSDLSDTLSQDIAAAQSSATAAQATATAAQSAVDALETTVNTEVQAINNKFCDYYTKAEVNAKDDAVTTTAKTYTDEEINRIMPLIYAGL